MDILGKNLYQYEQDDKIISIFVLIFDKNSNNTCKCDGINEKHSETDK